MTTSTYPQPLKQPEYADLIARAQRGDIAARNKVVTHSLRLVMSRIAAMRRRVAFSEQTELEMVQSAVVGYKRNCGLMRAVECYDASRGYNWTTVATLWVDSAIKQVLTDLSRHAPLEMPETEIESTGPSPESVTAAAEESRLLAAALRDLPDDQRQPLEAVLGGATYAEFGAAVGKSRETVRQRALRGAAAVTQKLRG